MEDSRLNVRSSKPRQIERHSARQNEVGRRGAVSKREWDTPVREPWNVLIHQALQAIDRHNMHWFTSQDPIHLRQASLLREYVRDLKAWIHQQEQSNA